MSEERPDCSGSASALACNRKPFQTDSSCDRGDVDIKAFKDFPFCEPITPTPADTGTPHIDFPVIPISAPPCVCVNIDMSGSGKVEDRKGVDVKTEFKSVGDCCEGKYKADIKVNVPCIPFTVEDLTKGGKQINIDEDCERTEASGSFTLGISSGNCTLKFDPKINIRIPRAKTYGMTPELVLTHACGTTASGSFGMEVDRDACSVRFRPRLKLNIPPAPQFKACSSGTVTIKKPGLGGSGSLRLNTESDSCGNTKSLCPVLNLNLPCPLPQEVKFNAQIEWKNKKQHNNIVIARKKTECSLEIPQPTIDLGLPCPITSDITTTTSIKWGQPQEQTVTLLRKVEPCTFAAPTGGIEFSIPCPIQKLKNKHPFKIRKRVKWGEWEDPIVSSSLAWYESSCSLKVRQSTAAFELDIPCPIQADEDNSIVKIKPEIGLCDCNCINFKPIDEGAKCCCDCKNYNGRIACHLGGTCCDCTNFEAADSSYGRNCACGTEESITILEKDPKTCKLVFRKEAIQIPACIPFTNASVLKFIGTDCSGETSGIAKRGVRFISAPDSNVKVSIDESSGILNIAFGIYYV